MTDRFVAFIMLVCFACCALGFLAGWLAARYGRAFMEQDGHDYTSTACQHGLHERCRRSCKYCGSPCACNCHVAVAIPPQRQPKQELAAA